jgi:SpoVK/Ycf46/Vps4 family AAA+-type ATPase
VLFFQLSPAHLLSKWTGQSEKLIRAVFARAKRDPTRPSVIFIDEIDSIASKQNGAEDSGASRRLLTELLINVSEAEDTHAVSLIATTNRPEQLDPAILRRMDYRIAMPLPTPEDRLAMLELFVSDIVDVDSKSLPPSQPNDPSQPAPALDLSVVVDATHGYSGSDLKKLVRTAVLRLIKEVYVTEATSLRPLTTDDFTAALASSTAQSTSEFIANVSASTNLSDTSSQYG